MGTRFYNAQSLPQGTVIKIQDLDQLARKTDNDFGEGIRHVERPRSSMCSRCYAIVAS
jgi:hypothetical protein